MKLNLILVKDVFGHVSTISADQIVSFEHSVPNVDGVKAIELSNERRLIVPNKEADFIMQSLGGISLDATGHMM